MNERAQLNPNCILHANITADELVDEISLIETRMGSLEIRTITSSKIGPCIGPAAKWEEVMMQRDSFENASKKKLDNWKSMFWFG